MAVMTSLHPDGISIQDKTHPVPSTADTMALELDINGHSVHDEPARDSSVPEPAVTFNAEPTPSIPVSTEVNGVNADAFTANSEISNSLDSAEPPIPPQEREVVIADTIAETVSLSTGEPVEEVTTTIVSDISNVEETSEPPPALEEISAPAVVEAISEPPAIGEVTQVSAVVGADEPPAVVESSEAFEIDEISDPIPSAIEAPESDLREEPSPITQEEAAEVQAEKHEMDLAADPELAAGLTASGNDDIQRDLPDLTAETSTIPTASAPTSFEDQPLHPASASDIDVNASQTQDTSTTSFAQPDADIPMMDAPASPTKIAREREADAEDAEDAEDEPSAKRAKTEDVAAEITEAAAPPVATETMADAAPAPETTNTVAPLVPAPGDEEPPTAYQVKEMSKTLKHVKNTTNGKNFARPVVEAWPTLAEGYLAKVSNPIDLGMIEQKLKDNSYATILDYKKDLHLVYENSVIFNGLDHSVTKSALTVRDAIFNKIPGPEPVKQEKKPRRSTPNAEAATRAVPSRRQSKANAAATSPTSTTTPQTFALDPSGTPVIRRDSTKGEGGRPKREIHPPKSKDLIYSARPKKKKFATELKFCSEVLTEMKKPKYNSFSNPFLAPVDPVALGIPEYFKIIKSPMDISLISTKLNSGQYENAKDFESDMRLMFKNCYKFNPGTNAVSVMGKQYEELFDSEWAKKNQYVADHTTSGAASPESDAEFEEEESEEEPEEEARPGSAEAILNQRLVEEQQKLIDIMTAKKPDQALVQMQQEMVAIVKKQLEAEAAKRQQKKPRAKPAKKGAVKKEAKAKGAARGYKVKNIGHTEKEQISAGIGQLEGRAMDQAIALLKTDIPDLDLEAEPELDIDVFSLPTLSKLHDLIVKHVPGIVPAAPEPRGNSRASKPSKPRKNKPMSKTEQEANIKKLKDLSQQFDRAGSHSDDATHGSGNIYASVEQDQSSGDESPSDSEED